MTNIEPSGNVAVRALTDLTLWAWYETGDLSTVGIGSLAVLRTLRGEGQIGGQVRVPKNPPTMERPFRPTKREHS
jgi:hypothetical protein